MKKSILYGMIFCSVFANAQVGINTQNPQGVFHTDGKSSTETTNNSTGVPTDAQLSDDVVIMPDGRVGLGTIPDPSAMLEINVSQQGSGQKKAFLGPRVALTSYNDTAPIA